MMKLLALVCPQCQERLPVENDDVVVACPRCQQAVHLDDQAGLKLLEAQYGVARDVEMVTQWLPFWVFRGRVVVQKRETQSGNRRSAEEAAAMWGMERWFYVPAWSLSVELARRLGTRDVD